MQTRFKPLVDPQPGDRIVVKLGNDRAHLDKISESGERVPVRHDIRVKDAWEIARMGASEDRGRVLICSILTPDLCELY